MFPCQNRIWFVLVLLERCVSCQNTQKFSSLQISASCTVIIFCVYRCMCLCAQRCPNSLCVSVFEFILNAPVVSCHRGNTCPFMCRENTKYHHQCAIMWYWRTGLWGRMWHLTLPTAADCYTTIALTGICVCAQSGSLGPFVCECVSTTHLFPIEVLLHHCMLVEPPLNKQNHLEMLLCAGYLRAFQSASHDDTLVFVIHHRKFLPFCGTKEFYRGRARTEQPHPWFSGWKFDNLQREHCPSQHTPF